MSCSYKIPNRKRWLLTNKFLKDFKNELDKVFDRDKEEASYYFYYYVTNSAGFYKALKNTSIKNNVYYGIYKYACNLPWYQSDLFDCQLVNLMLDKNILKDDVSEKEDLIFGEKDGLVKKVFSKVQKDGYSVISFNY